jgi:hypothetical protein
LGKHPTSSAKVSGEFVEQGTADLSREIVYCGASEASSAAALAAISARSVTSMPKWIVYCTECNRPSTYVEIRDKNIDLANPMAKKPIVAEEGDKWGCPYCKRESRVRECDLTYSYS